nr:filaggrin-2-like isoform X2 [Ipomoea trifida]
MREQSNGLRNLASSDKRDKGGGGSGAYNNNHTRASHTNDNNHHHHSGVGGSVSSETSHESKKGGSSSGSDAIPAVWPPKFVIALTIKEKEEDFMAIKGSKLPQRPEPNSSCIFFYYSLFNDIH